MSPADIVIAACLGAGPASLGLLLAFFISNCYLQLQYRRSKVSSDSWFYREFEIDRVSVRCFYIFLFWAIVGLSVGGFAAGVYVQQVLDLYGLLVA